MEKIEKAIELEPNNLKFILTKGKLYCYWNELKECVNTEKKYQDSIDLYK